MNDEIEEGFPMDTEEPKIIKVIGVGGGGGNAVTHMYNKKDIHDVSFLLCNTDRQALKKSGLPEPLLFLLGEKLTGGWGAGGDPDVAREAAIESEADIRQLLGDVTKMVFITAGMGGGTGTGAAPVIAKIAKDMGILTIGIVTIPFEFEGEPRILQALHGVEAIRGNVDSLLVISNNRLLEVFREDEESDVAFAKADETLAVAAKSIAELITSPGKINLDFADVRTTLKNGGVALMSNGYGEGYDRFQQAIKDALNSPLLNNNDIFKAKKLLFNISYSEEAKLLIRELKEMNTFMSGFDKTKIQVKWGQSVDDALGSKLKVTILASGFGRQEIPDMDKLIPGTMEDKAKEEKKKELLVQYGYGKRGNNVREINYIILSTEDLDDEGLISLLEDNPTYNRNPRVVKDYKDKAAPVHPTSPKEPGGLVISF